MPTIRTAVVTVVVLATVVPAAAASPGEKGSALVSSAGASKIDLGSVAARRSPWVGRQRAVGGCDG